MTSIKYFDATDDYYFLAGSKMTSSTTPKYLIKINPLDYSDYTVISDGEYEFKDMKANPDNSVTFKALRLSDLKYVEGKISSTGSVTTNVVSEDFVVYDLVKVN
jgi:hypothetical protein